MSKSYKLWISGSEPDLEELKELARQLGIEKSVVFLGELVMNKS